VKSVVKNLLYFTSVGSLGKIADFRLAQGRDYSISVHQTMKLREKTTPSESVDVQSAFLTDAPDTPGFFRPAALRIHDMPHDDRPREKLAKLGAAALDNAELMALFLSTGTRGRSAIEIGRDLVRKYGSLGALGGLPVGELAKEHGIGLAKASKLAAAFELGSRVARELVRNTPLDTP